MKVELEDPKSLSDALEKGDALPFDPGAIDLARTLAKSLEPSRAKELERLPEPLALAVLESAVRQQKVDFADALASSPIKPLSKAAKKALYRLRSRGIPVPELKPVAVAAAVSAVERREDFPSLLSPITGEGERAVVLARAMRGGFETSHLVISDEKGVVQVEIHDSSRSSYRSMLRDLKNKRTPAVAVPLAEARALVAQAVAKNLETKTPFPQGLDDVIRHFGISPSPASETIPAPEPNDAELAAQADQLHQEPEIRAWLPPMDQLKLLALKMDEISQSQLYIHETQRSEQASHVVQSMARSFFTPETSKLYARRIWAMADYLERTDRPTAAQRARAEAKRLFHGAEGRFSVFAEKLFQKVVDFTRRARAGQSAPDEDDKTEKLKSEPTERRSSGGLILP